MNNINNLILDEERALYHITDSNIVNCRFDGPKDGESAIKECRNIHIVECYFNLRYPIWHTYPVTMTRSTMTEFCRAALWYCHNVKIEQSKLYGIKALRECQNIEISQCDIISKEFGWKNDDLKIVDSTLEGEYAFFDSKNLVIKNFKFVGKYSFQYCKNLTIESEDLAYIPTQFKTEIFCWEFKGKVKDTEFLVYINAETGKEEDILVIKNTPNGTLTM